GPSAVSWLRGMFAFACWNPKQRRLLMARDALGIKPLYLARSSDPKAGWSVAFASELRTLLASGLLGTPDLDPQAVASTVWRGFLGHGQPGPARCQKPRPYLHSVLRGAGVQRGAHRGPDRRRYWDAAP